MTRLIYYRHKKLYNNVLLNHIFDKITCVNFVIAVKLISCINLFYQIYRIQKLYYQNKFTK